MKIGRTLSFVRNAGLFGLLVFTTACDNNNPSMNDPFDLVKFNPYSDGLVEHVEVNKNTIAPDNSNPKRENTALYIDFSSDINKAFNGPAIKGKDDISFMIPQIVQYLQ